jgi:tetratricopeptide (TPR) repeat protein
MPPSSWGTISGETYLYNHETQEKYPLLKCDGLPISPQKRDFTIGGMFHILFYFPPIPNIDTLDFIENPNQKAFNIYGIDVTKHYELSYTIADIEDFYKMASTSESDNDTIKALEYKEQEKEATAFIYGIKSEHLLMVTYDLCSLYEKYGFYQNIDTLDDNLEKLQLLLVLSNAFSHKNDYIKALKYREKSLKIGEKIWGTEHPEYATSLHELSRNNYFLGNYNEAIRLGTKALEIRKRLLGIENLDYATTLSDLALYYSVLGNYEKAIQLSAEAMAIRKRLLGIENSDYATTLGNLSNYYAYLGNYEEAIRLGMEALEIRKRVLGMNHPDYAMTLNNLAVGYSHLGNYNEAIRLGIEALETRKRILGIEHPSYATTLGNLAVDYSRLGNYEEAIRLGTEALNIRKRILGTDHSEYASSLNDLASFYSGLGNYKEAIRLGTEALENRKRILGMEHPDYALSLSNLASFYSDLGNYNEAIRLGTEALEIRKRILGTEHPDYAMSLSNLAADYAYIGNYKKATRLGTEALEIRKRVHGTEHPDYAQTLSNLASFYSDLGNYNEAIRLGTEALEIRKKILGTEHPDYAMSLSKLAIDYSHLGNYEEAIRLGTEALEIRKRVIGTEHPYYAWSLSDLSAYYAYLGNYGEAIRFGTEALEIRKKALGMEHPDYAMSIGNIAGYYGELGNYREAIRLGTEALEIRKRILGTEHPSYATVLSNLALYNSHLGNYEEAMRLGTEALEIRKRVLDPEHPDYAISLGNLASYYSTLRNHTEAYLSLKKSIEASLVYMLRIFAEQSSHLRETFWGKQEYIYTQHLPFYVYKYKNAESIAELYDKTCLFAKGLLLNSDIELRKLILESEDSILIDKYNMLSTNINIYNKLIEKPINERYMNADSLNNVIQQQEMELARESKVYGDYTRNLTSTWKDVRDHLNTDDIAIEFIDFPILRTDSIMYAALTLKKDYDSPHMVMLFEKKQLMAIPDSSYYTQTSTYDLIWKPLEKELENVNDIYFAPSGELHRIGIEYLPVSRTENISDKYSLHRLSSTRQLALIQEGTKGEQNILYGGINYDERTNAVPDNSTSSDGSYRRIEYRANVDSLSLRSSFDYLEGTKRETDQIADQMKQHQIHYLYYSGSDGSEESFKKLDGTRPKMMHIATHGFYLTQAEAKQSNFACPYIELMMEDNQRTGRPIEDKPMTRSGLLFSGCNHAINHERIPDGVEDGILTAQEISTLDLRGLDLVVLSACQTALGDIASGEGVFGLQRGFKKAGAKTILMSIDKVDDEATRILMVEFYNNLMSGKSKYQSLKDAQKYLREYDNRKYDNPKYWASFIMLDGLD